MKLATIKNNTPDGRLVIVSSDGQRYIEAAEPLKTLQGALDNWSDAESSLREQFKALENGDIDGRPINSATMAAPLPRAWQWLDGSVYINHAVLMSKSIGMFEAFKERGLDPENPKHPSMYQGVSSTFYGPGDDIPMSTEDYDIDFEGEFGVIVDEVPMGVTPEQARKHIKLLVQINDWSLRKFSGPELMTGFGWIHAKPPCAVAPFAVTPDSLGSLWDDTRINLRLNVKWNGEQFGNAHGGEMAFGFDEIVAHAAKTRALVAGTIIGSGTVSNTDYKEVGSSCIAERRAAETIELGAPKTHFMRFGDQVRMEAQTPDGKTVFGVIDQKIIEA